MINEMILASQLLAGSYLPTCIYVPVLNIEEYEDVIKTNKKSIKNITGDYPWESTKVINGETYYVYKGYFRTKKIISKFKVGRYINKLCNETGRGKYYLQNRNDSSEILYYNIDDIMDILNSRIDAHEQTFYREEKTGRNLLLWINHLRIMELLSE